MYHNRPVFSNESEGILLFGSELNKEKITKNTEHSTAIVQSCCHSRQHATWGISCVETLLCFRKQVLHF